MTLTRQLSLTLADARTKFRAYTRDEDTVAPAHSDAQVNRILADIYEKLWTRWNTDRVRSLGSNHLWGTVTPPVADSFTYIGTTYKIQRVLRVYRDSGPGPLATELEKMERHTLIGLQRTRPQTTELPKAYCAERTDENDAASVNNYVLRLWPQTASGTAFSITADVLLQSPVALTADGDLFDLDVEQANIVARTAAAVASARMGWPQEYVESIWRTVPEDVQAIYGSEQSSKSPRVRDGEVAY